MKKHNILLCLLLISLLAQGQRQVFNINKDWKFSLKPQTEKSSTDGWGNVTIPHTWNVEDVQDSVVKTQITPYRTFGYYRGIGWYVKTIQAPESWKGKRIFVRFEAASIVARVYINSQLIGEHKGAFTAFCFELTNFINFGQENELRVEVDNRWRDDVPPISGGFNLFGGLYRPASIIVTDTVCVSPIHYASSGVYVETPVVSTKSAQVNVRAMLHYGRYQYDKVSGRVPSTKVTMSVILRDASGKELQRKDGDEIILSGDLTPCVRSFIIENPHFWNGLKDPYQYIAEVIIKRDKQVIDNVKQKFGLRTVAISQEKGFELNGEAYPIYGVCRHQDVRDKGWAVSSEDELRDFEMIKEVGATAVRLAHYPQSANVHEIADSLGILTWDEISLVNDTRDNQTFTQNCKQFMEEMVHQLYNHPSIAWWGLFNEVNHPETPVSLSIFSELKQIAKAEGGQRITVGASNTGDRYFNQIPDAICFNNYPGWYLQQRWPARENYTGDLSRFGEFIDYRYKEFGNRRIAMSEYGAGGDPTQHIEGKLIQPADPSTVREQPEEWEAYVHEQDWKALKNNPKIWGSFIWAMFDFSMNGGRESSILNINTKGLITHDRKTRKDPFYFYKANWNPEPMVYIASRRMVERKLAVTDIKIYSNCPSVTLYLNGKKIGTKKPDLVEVCTFENITLKPGKNTIKAIVLSGKKKIQDKCEWNLSIK